MAKKIFTLEVVAAKHGDCLLLHWGDADNPRLILTDGGPRGVYTAFLSKRLKALAERRGSPLSIDLIMISHVDDDHIRGILDLTARIEDLEDEGKAVPYEIDGLWLNSFDDVVANTSAGSVAALNASVFSASLPAELRHSGATISSVGQGRNLRDRAKRMGMLLNGGDPLIVDGWIWNMGDGLSFHVLGPRQQRIDEFQEAWDKELRAKNWAVGVDSAEVAAFLDKSPWNLASTIVLAQFGSKKMLLTGDARGDDVLEGLREGGILTGNSTKVHILKVPHHGSDRNVSTDFFRAVRADHYVISGNGGHGNPEISALRMILEARGNESYKVHCTYRSGKKRLKGKLTTFLNSLPKSQQKKFVFRKETDLSMKINLVGNLKD